MTSTSYRPDRTRWHRSSIGAWVQQSQPFEVKFVDQLAKWLTQHQSDLCIIPHRESKHRHDAIVTSARFPGTELLVELECGMNQPQWQQNLLQNRTRWKYGLNVLSRKVSEGKHYDIFIKHNRTGESFFACSYDFIQHQGQLVQLRGHSLGFKTDDHVFAIDWKWVESPNHGNEQIEFCYDSSARLVALMEQLLAKKHQAEQGATEPCVLVDSRSTLGDSRSSESMVQSVHTMVTRSKRVSSPEEKPPGTV